MWNETSCAKAQWQEGGLSLEIWKESSVSGEQCVRGSRWVCKKGAASRPCRAPQARVRTFFPKHFSYWGIFRWEWTMCEILFYLEKITQNAECRMKWRGTRVEFQTILKLWLSQQSPSVNLRTGKCLKVFLQSLPRWSHQFHGLKCYLYPDDNQICNSRADLSPNIWCLFDIMVHGARDGSHAEKSRNYQKGPISIGRFLLLN